MGSAIPACKGPVLSWCARPIRTGNERKQGRRKTQPSLNGFSAGNSLLWIWSRGPFNGSHSPHSPTALHLLAPKTQRRLVRTQTHPHSGFHRGKLSQTIFFFAFNPFMSWHSLVRHKITSWSLLSIFRVRFLIFEGAPPSPASDGCVWKVSA